MPGVEALTQLSGDIAAGRIQPQLLDQRADLAPDHLYWLFQVVPEDRGAQDVMAPDHRFQGLDITLQGRPVAEAHQAPEQIGIAIARHQVVEQHALLQRRQRVDILHIVGTTGHRGDNGIDLRLVQCRQRQALGRDRQALDNAVGRDRRRDFGHFDPGGQLAQHRRTEHKPRIQFDALAAQAFEHPQGRQRMAAEGKEVVVAADPFAPEHMGPGFGQGDFHRPLRGAERPGAEGAVIRCRQRPAIELAVGGQRQCLQTDIGGRHHMLRQRRRQLRAQFADTGHGPFGGRVVGHQARLSRLVLAGDDHRFAHAGAAAQAGLDLPQLDTETADLHLEIVASEELQTAVGPIAGQVAGAVQAIAGDKGIVDKAFGRQGFAVQVAPGDPGPADMDLAFGTDRQQLPGRIEQVATQVRQRPADGAGTGLLGIFGAQGQIGRVHGDFGDAVHVDQLRVAVARVGEPRLERGGFQRLATEHHVAQAVSRRAAGLGAEQAAEGARSLVEDRHTLLAEQLVEVCRGPAGQARDNHQASAMEQRPPDFPDREVEGEGMEQGPDIVAVEMELRGSAGEQPGHLGMLDHHALGRAGGARGVDDIGQVIRGHARFPRVEIVVGTLGPTRGVGLQVQQPWLVRQPLAGGRQAGPGWRMGQDHRRRAVGEQQVQALARVDRVQRHIGAAGLEDRQQSHQHVQGTFDTQAHQHIGTDAEGTQMPRQSVGPGIQLAVAEGLAFATDRRGPGIARHLFFEQLLQATRRFTRRGHPVPFFQQAMAFLGTDHRVTVEMTLGCFQALSEQIEVVVAQTGHGVFLEQIDRVVPQQ